MSRHLSNKSCEVLLCNLAALTFGLFKAIAQELGSCKSRVDHAWGDLLPAGNVLQPTIWQDETQRVVGCVLAPSAAAPIAAAAPPAAAAAAAAADFTTNAAAGTAGPLLFHNVLCW